jgi:hypothetical protein
MAGGSGPLSPKAATSGAVASGASGAFAAWGGLLQASAVAVVAAIIARRFVSAPSSTERTLNLDITAGSARAADLRFHYLVDDVSGRKMGRRAEGEDNGDQPGA